VLHLRGNKKYPEEVKKIREASTNIFCTLTGQHFCTYRMTLDFHRAVRNNDSHYFPNNDEGIQNQIKPIYMLWSIFVLDIVFPLDIHVSF